MTEAEIENEIENLILDRLARLRAARDDCVRLAKAILLFHGPNPWSLASQQAWQALTGEESCTSQVLCSLARNALARMEGT
jgi:hypothetical protein